MKKSDEWLEKSIEAEKQAHILNHRAIACAVLSAILTIIALVLGYNLTNIG